MAYNSPAYYRKGEAVTHDCYDRGRIDDVVREVFAVKSLAHLDLFSTILLTARFLKHLANEQQGEEQLSSARLRLLTHLVIAERRGQPDGLPPSELSRCLSVSRNTISALLNGLEEQGLVERHLHPTDRRQFLIRITPSGLAVVRERSPEFARRVADLLDALTPEEQATLTSLLHKVLDRLVEQAGVQGLFPPAPPDLGET
jgi:DNA-binding MarR family transcriptional regulator